MSKIMMVVALVFATAGILIWAAFLRPVPVSETTAVIRAKTFKPAGTYWQHSAGIDRGFRTATPIATSEAYVLELHSPELGLTGFYSIPPEEEVSYPIGGTVVMQYQRRGLPLVGYNTTVLSAGPR